MMKPLQWLFRQRLPIDQVRFHDLRGETRWLLYFAIAYIVASAATGLAIKYFPMPLWGATDFLQDCWYVVLFKLVLLLALPLTIFLRWGYRLSDLLYGWRFSFQSTTVLVLCYALGVFTNAGRFGEIGAAYASHPAGEALARAVIGVALAFWMAGIPEEVVYRGLIQTHFEASWGRAAAISVSLVLFVAWHIPTRFLLANSVEGRAGDLPSVLVGTGIPVAVVALVFALAWDRFRNLPALIAIHSGIDTVPIVASMLQSTAESWRW